MIAREPVAADVVRGRARRPLRVGVINIMPRAETYEPFIVRPLAGAPQVVDLNWIRLRSHRYASSDPGHIERHYATFDAAMADGPLDGVVVTGAPVEELPFQQVRYWAELCEIFARCRAEVASVLGICWGALALAKQLGIEKHRFEKKLFGVFPEAVIDGHHPVVGAAGSTFHCAHSRHAGVRPRELEDARDSGAVRLLTYGPETGYSIFESADGRFLMHLGHPEYEAERLAIEWARDSALGRTDVDPPRHFDPSRPVNVWRSHCDALFSRWLQSIASAGHAAAHSK